MGAQPLVHGMDLEWISPIDRLNDMRLPGYNRDLEYPALEFNLAQGEVRNAADACSRTLTWSWPAGVAGYTGTSDCARCSRTARFCPDLL